MKPFEKIWHISSLPYLFTLFFSLLLFGWTSIAQADTFPSPSWSGSVATFGSDFAPLSAGHYTNIWCYSGSPSRTNGATFSYINPAWLTPITNGGNTPPSGLNSYDPSLASDVGYANTSPVGGTLDINGIQNPYGGWTTNHFCEVWDSNNNNQNSGTTITYRGFFSFNYSGSGNATPPDPFGADHSTRLVTLHPLMNEATTSDATSSPQIYGSLHNEQALYDRMIIDLSWVEPSVNADLLLSDTAHRQLIFPIGTSTTDQSFSTSTSDLLTGRWLMNTVFSNSTDGSSYFTASTTSFIVGTSTTLFSDFVSYSTTTPAGQILPECSSASSVTEKTLCWFGDRFKDVMLFLFIPSDTIVGKYSQLKDAILIRAPFGYFGLIKTALSNVSASSTPIYQYVIPLSRSNLFSTLRSAASGILYIWWLVHMWHRVRSIQLS